MKPLILLLTLLSLNFPAPEKATIDTDALNGAWEANYVDENGKAIRIVAIVSDGYYTSTAFGAEDGSFENTNGGLLELTGNAFKMTYEFNLAEKEKVGSSETLTVNLNDDVLIFEGYEDMEWTRIDDGTPGDLYGAWLITGRQRNGEISRSTPGVRKTMKILSGTRFQWIAYNTETGEFFGTGGGTYTTENGKYTENIEFFSRDNSRVGATLQFDYDIKDGEWHHSGFSSKGDPLYEIWTNRADLD